MFDLPGGGLANVNVAARWRWEVLILDGSVIGLLLLVVPRCFDQETREGLDDDASLLFVELLP